MQVVVTRGGEEFIGGRGTWPSVKTEAVDRHDEPAEFGHHVFALGEFAHCAFPVVENLRALVGIWTDSQRPPEVVEDDGLVRERPCQVGQFGNLGVVQPAIEGHAALAEFRETGPEAGVGQHAGHGRGVRIAHVFARVPTSGMANSAKPRTGCGVGVENFADRSPEVQIRVTDDRCARPGIAVDTARTHGRDAVDELGLANRFQRPRSVGTVHGAALHEHRRADVVTAADIDQQLIEQIAAARVVPEVVVGVADREVRFDDVLVHLREPFVAIHSDKPRCLGHAQ